MNKKILLVINLIGILIFTFSIPAYADTVEADDAAESKHTIVTTTEAERDAMYEKEMEKVMEKIEKEDSIAKGPKYQYKTVKKSPVYTTAKGYAGNQVAGGYRFKTGGGFWHTDSGGPSIDAQATVNFPAPFEKVFAFSVTLGVKGPSNSGIYVEAPDKTNYYRLYIKKTMEVRRSITYRAPKGTDDWEVYNCTSVPVLYKIDASAKKVS